MSAERQVAKDRIADDKQCQQEHDISPQEQEKIKYELIVEKNNAKKEDGGSEQRLREVSITEVYGASRRGKTQLSHRK